MTPEKIFGVLRQVEVELPQGRTMGEAYREVGISEASFHCWQTEYGGLRTKLGA
jgi:hypothetical protein